MARTAKRDSAKRGRGRPKGKKNKVKRTSGKCSPQGRVNKRSGRQACVLSDVHDGKHCVFNKPSGRCRTVRKTSGKRGRPRKSPAAAVKPRKTSGKRGRPRIGRKAARKGAPSALKNVQCKTLKRPKVCDMRPDCQMTKSGCRKRRGVVQGPTGPSIKTAREKGLGYYQGGARTAKRDRPRKSPVRKKSGKKKSGGRKKKSVNRSTVCYRNNETVRCNKARTKKMLAHLKEDPEPYCFLRKKSGRCAKTGRAKRAGWVNPENVARGRSISHNLVPYTKQ